MKLICRFLLAIIFYISIQNLSSQKLTQSDYYYFKQYSSFEQIGTDSNFVFFLTTQPQKNTKKLLIIDSNNLNIISIKTISFESKKEFITEAILINKKLYLETSTYVKRSENVINNYVLDPYTLKLIGNEKINKSIIANSMVLDSVIFYNYFYKFINEGDENDILGVRQLFDNNFEISYQNQKNGNIHFYESYLKDVKIFSKISNVIKYIDLRNGLKILKCNLFFDSDSTYRFVGIYYDSKDKSYGLFQMFLNFNLEEILTTSYLTLIDNKGLPQENKNSEFVFNNYQFKHYLHTPNGNHILIFNSPESNSETNSYMSFENNANKMKYEIVTFNSVHDILIYNFHQSGEISYSKIPLSQSTDLHKKSTSYLVNIIDNHLVFVYFDNKKNISSNELISCDFSNSKTVLVSSKYDFIANEMSEKVIIADNKELEYFFNFKEVNAVPNGKFKNYFFISGKKYESIKFKIYKLQM